jgi:hypothetical protein
VVAVVVVARSAAASKAIAVKFFIPGIPDTQTETTYKSLYDAAKDQLRTPITDKRVFSLRYIHDKRAVNVVVGEAHPHHPNFVILAILESQPLIVVTQARNGQSGPTIMITNAEVTDMVEFD